MPKVSIVTPVYNAAAFLPTLFESLKQQTFTDWEWVVVDDGSTDGSGKMLDSYAAEDSRVVVIHQENSGAAKMPRDRAVYYSSSDKVMMIDADDNVEGDYIQKMYNSQLATGADIIYPQMLFVRNGKTEITLPDAGIDISHIYTGKEALLFTLPEWRIGCNGGLYNKKVWVNMSYPVLNQPIYMNSDEVDERLYLLEAKNVAFCDAKYQYNLHPEAITKEIRLNRFDILDTDLQLLSIIKDTYGHHSEAYAKARRKVFSGFRNAMRLYMEHYNAFGDSRPIIINKLRKTFQEIADIRLTSRERIQFLGMKSFRMVLLLASIKYRGFNGFCVS